MTAPLTDARLDEIARYCSGNTFHEQAIRDLLTALAQCREEQQRLADQLIADGPLLTCPWCGESQVGRIGHAQISHLIECGDRKLAQCREEREAAVRIGAEASAGLLEAYEGQVAHTDLVRAEYQKRLAAATAALAAAREMMGRLALRSDGHYLHCPGEQFHDRPEHDCPAIRDCVEVRAFLAGDAPGQREEGT